MSTTALFAVCALLVFSPFLLEGGRFVRRMIAAAAKQRPAPPPPEYGASFEASVQDALYGHEPRWQRLDVRPAQPGAGRPAPPAVLGRPETGAPLRPLAPVETERPDANQRAGKEVQAA